MKALTVLRHPAITSVLSAMNYVVIKVMATEMVYVLMTMTGMACKTLVAISVENSFATNVKPKKEMDV